MAAPAQTATDRLTATLTLDEPVVRVSGVSHARAQTLSKLGIATVRDLITHYPRRYLDHSALLTIGRARIGDRGTIVGRVEDVRLKRPRRNLSIVEIALADGTGVLVVSLFGNPRLASSFKVGETLTVAGVVDFRYGFKQMANPYWEKMSDQEAVGRIIPVHSVTQGLSAPWMRRLIHNALTLTRGLYDPLPLALRASRRLMSRGQALVAIHFPDTMEEMKRARQRLAYEELLLLELHLMSTTRARSAAQTPHEAVVNGPAMARWRAQMPFALTGDQERAVEELLDSMARPEVMSRLILGDVGTGKTIVAAFGIVACSDSGTQALLMAPTEVLARQHFASLEPLLTAAGVKIALLTGSTEAAEREMILAAFAAGDLDALIGTHALIEPTVVAHDLALAIIDEQQRFGVEQRAALLSKGTGVDVLSLTATPIPRTLALAIYGDLALSYLVERPFELTRTTKVVPRPLQGDAYEAAREALARGHQVYVVCPLIHESAASKGSDEDKDELSIAIEDESDFGIDTSGAVRKAKQLQSGVFREWNVGLLHGGLSSADKAAVMASFAQGECQVLVATTIIEVGVDVAAANVMIIEDADRFGLSQLHQLRGRVGRHGEASEVYLISSSTNETALARLQAMERTDDGFELASYDLSLRREGDILGNRQHGTSVLKLVNVMRDGELIEAARDDAQALLDEDPSLKSPKLRALGRELALLFGEDGAERTPES